MRELRAQLAAFKHEHGLDRPATPPESPTGGGAAGGFGMPMLPMSLPSLGPVRPRTPGSGFEGDNDGRPVTSQSQRSQRKQAEAEARAAAEAQAVGSTVISPIAGTGGKRRRRRKKKGGGGFLGHLSTALDDPDATPREVYKRPFIEGRPYEGVLHGHPSTSPEVYRRRAAAREAVTARHNWAVNKAEWGLLAKNRRGMQSVLFKSRPYDGNKYTKQHATLFTPAQLGMSNYEDAMVFRR